MISGIDEKIVFYMDSYRYSLRVALGLGGKERRIWRFVSRSRAIAGWPIWALRWAVMMAVTVGRTGARWHAQRSYIGRFWRWYFEHRECTFYTTQDLGVSSTGRLILAVRSHFMDGPFLLQALDCPVIMPIPKALAQFRLIRWINTPNFYKQLKPVMMDDLGTDAQYHNIVRLIERGYSVVAFINPEVTDRKLSMQLDFETQVTSLIRQVKDVTLVDHTEFVKYPLAGGDNPVIIRVRVTPLSEVIDPEGRPDSQVVQQIAGWYGFRTGSVIRRS